MKEKKNTSNQNMKGKPYTPEQPNLQRTRSQNKPLEMEEVLKQQ
jgi:hypothetical protein